MKVMSTATTATTTNAFRKRSEHPQDYKAMAFMGCDVPEWLTKDLKRIKLKDGGRNPTLLLTDEEIKKLCGADMRYSVELEFLQAGLPCDEAAIDAEVSRRIAADEF